MKYKIINDMRKPNRGSFILVCKNDENIIGLIEKIMDDGMIILMLNKNGYIKINHNDEWLMLNVSTLDDLRNNYRTFINKNVEAILQEKYNIYAKKNGLI
jgi:hypothetical protein